MELADDALLDDTLDDGSEDEGEAPPSSGPASTPTSCASSPPGVGEEPASPHGGSSMPPSFFHHQAPYVRPFFTPGRRGPGRPRKEGIKLAREGKVVRRYRGNSTLVRGAKRHRISREDSLDDLFDEDDFTMPAPEEPPYFPEKWPGKLCVLCNLSERSQLGQGEMRQLTCRVPEELPSMPCGTAGSMTPGATPTTPSRSGGSTPSTPVTPDGVLSHSELDIQLLQLNAAPSRRQKGANKCKTPLHNIEHTDELSIIGHSEVMELPYLVSSGVVYVHRFCLEFTPPFAEQVAAGSQADDDSREGLEEARIKGIVTAALLRKCTFCMRYGASIPCKMSCSKYFHFPCVLASGGFQDFQTKSSFCKEHLYQVPLVCSADIDCRNCRVVGDLANLMTCVTCGAHYHGTCVGLSQAPGVRAGWSCRQCRVCQVCRSETGSPLSYSGSSEPRTISCEQCDKLYHATCLRPIVATIPKYGWKCKCCRICSDCGSRSPGAGPSSRWHSHYTVCDSCYQQRNKGSSCPLCRRAYRAAAQRDMIRCTLCKRYVHGQCDPEADPATHQARREVQPSYIYVCPMCKPLANASAQIIKRKDSIEDDSMTTVSQDSNYGDDPLLEQDPLALDIKPDVGLGKGKPYTVSSKISKNKMGSFKFKGGFAASGKLAFQKRQRSTFLDFGRKRGSKPKMRGVFGVPGLGLQRPQPQDNKGTEEEPGMENKMVLCSSKDKFVLTQDLCVTCGAIGTDTEACLIACSQCGQTYHPYCAPVKVSRVVVTLGWRCLDCTVCEGCGSRGDDARLVLCDDCDTTRHTYCAKPPLPSVPVGAWRCERCRRCQTCGATSPGSSPCKWMNDYTECAPCASLVMCCVCNEPYNDGELIIQCEPCARWLHAACDGIRNDEEAEVCCRAGYQCTLCRPRDAPPPHIVQAAAAEPAPVAAPAPQPVTPPPPSLRSLGLAGEYYMDDVCLTARGIHLMKQIESELELNNARKKKRKFKNDNSEKEAVVHNTDTEGATEDNKMDGNAEVKEEPGTVSATYKEGTLWNVVKDGPVPEGFTIYTTDSGLTVLRRKRQRNLNKLGIGGFVVRQRQVNSKNQVEEEKEGDGSQPSGESPSNKRKPRRKPRSKLMEQFPSYMQEAFFGKELLEPSKPASGLTGATSESPGERSGAGSVTPDSLQFTRAELECSDSENEELLSVVSLFGEVDLTTTITLNKDEVEILDSMKPKEEKDDNTTDSNGTDTKVKVEAGLNDDNNLVATEDSTALKNAIMGPGQPGDGPTEGGGSQDISTVNGTKTEPSSDNQGTASSVASTISPKDDLSLLGVNLDAMVREGLPDMDSNDVDEIFKGYTDDSQESQESAVSFVNSVSGSSSYMQRQRLTSPSEYASPYHTEYSGSSQLSPAFSEGSGAWSSMSSDPPVPVHAAMQSAPTMLSMQQAGPPPPSQPTTTYNQRSADKMRADESLGPAATISAVLYANTNHPEWKTEFPNWTDRCKQILKKWRALPVEQKAPYLQRARDNRSAIRMKKAQQMSGATGTSGEEKETSEPPPATPAPPPPPVEQERVCGQQKSAREAEQERQWKQLQQMRLQQTQQQQQIIHDQRVQAMARMRVEGTDGGPGALDSVPRSVFPAQRFPLYSAAGETNAADINRQLRDLLQRNPDKMWQHQANASAAGAVGGEDGGTPTTPGLEGQPFRQPLPVGVRPRHPHPHPQLLRHPVPQNVILQQQQRLAGQAIEQVRQMQLQQQQAQQGDAKEGGTQADKEKQSTNATGAEARPEGAPAEEMEMGDMDKLEQDPTSMAEVGDILGGLGGDDDEELLESLTAEIGDDFNILEYADPELDAFNDADTEHILDGLELADEGGHERHTKREPQDEPEVKPDNKMDVDLRKAVKNMENASSPVAGIGPGSAPGTIKTEVKTELDTEVQTQTSPGRLVGLGPRPHMFQQMYPGPNQQRVMTPAQIQQQTMQQGLQRAGQFVSSVTQQHVMSQQVIQRAQFASQQHPMHFQQVQQGGSVGGNVSGNAAGGGMQPQVSGATGGQQWTRLPSGAVGIVRQDNTIALAVHPHSGGGPSVTPGAVQRAPPPPPYPGTPRHPAPPPPPPPYPQQMGFDCGDAWGDWLRTRRPLLLQEQPLLLEELLEQEKREQERQTEGEWVGVGSTAVVVPPVAVAPPAPAPPAVPLFTATPMPAPPQPPDRILTEADRQAQHLYEQWLQHHSIFVNDQLKYYETEVQKLRKMRKSLNSKQRQLRKSGNELAPADASELLRISNEQSVLQKHLESARKQSRQHSMLLQEYRNKQTQQNPQLAQQTVVGQQQMSTNQTVFAQNQNMPQSPQLQQQIERQNTINRQMQVIQSAAGQQTVVRQQSVIGPDGQQAIMGPQGRIGAIVASTHQIQAQSRIVQGARTLVIEQSSGGAQQQLVRQLSVGQNERGQPVTGMQQNTMHLQQFGQQQFQTIRSTGQPTVQRAGGQRPSMSPLHIQSPHSQSPLHSLAPQSPLHHLTSPLQSPLHSQQSPLHAQQSPLHTQQSPLHTQQSPLHSQQSPMHPQQSPMHVQQSQMLSQQSTIHNQQSSIIQQQQQQQQAMHQQQSPMHMQQSPLHSQQSPIHPQQSPMHSQHSPMHQHQSPMHSQQSPMHPQQSPMHTQQSPMQQQQNTISSPQHFLQQLQVQRTSPQLPTPSRSPQIYQQSQIQSPVASHSPQLQNQSGMDYTSGRFPRPAPGCSPLPTRFARPPHHQQGMRVGVSFGGRQTSPLGSPQPLPSPGNPSNDTLTRQQMLQRQQYSPMGGAPASPMSRSPHVPRTPTPSASPAASPAPQHDHGGGGHLGHHNAPFPPGFRYFKLGLFGGSPIWPIKSDEERRRTSHINKVSILKRSTPPRPRFGGKTPAPMPEPSEPILIEDIPESPTVSPQNSQEYVLYSSDGVDYNPEGDDTSRLGFGSKSDDTDVEEIVEGEHLDDDDIVVVEPGAISPDERIATEEDFEELIDSGKPEDENTDEEEKPKEKPPTRTETTTKTVAVISLAAPKQPQTNIQQYKFVNTGQGSSSLGRLPVLSATVLSPHGNTKILNEVSQATVASVSIANQTISVPVLKSLNVTNSATGGKTQIKKVPLGITNPSLSLPISKTMTSVISVISSNTNVPKVATLSPVISLATSSSAGSSRMPISILTQHQVKQKIVKSIDQPIAISLSTAKLSSLSVTHDATLPAKIFEDDVASPDSTVSQDTSAGNDALSQSSIKSQDSGMDMTDPPPSFRKSGKKSDVDIECEISQHTELPHTLCIPERSAPLILSKADIKSPDPIPEKIPDNIMEGDDEDKSEDEIKEANIALPIKCIPSVSVSDSSTSGSSSPRVDVNVVKTIKTITNTTKDMVIDSNMHISSDVSQESVQISIPSPTPYQEQYLNDLTVPEGDNRNHEENPKQVESIEDMLDMLENIDDPKMFSVKLGSQAQSKKPSPVHITKEVTTSSAECVVQHPTPIDSEAMKAMQETVQAIIKNKESERLMQSTGVPQLSPLSQPTDLTTNMANVSQQLRTIMSSLTTSKPESTMVSTSAPRKGSQIDSTTPTQINFENLLPSSKVEVIGSRPSPMQRHMEKQTAMATSMISSDNVPMSSALVLGSRVNTLSGFSQCHRSPNSTPNLSPVSMPSPLAKSPALSPMVSNMNVPDEPLTSISMSQQVIQMPALSKIHSQPAASAGHTNSSLNIMTSATQKTQMMASSILGTTLLQPTRQLSMGNMPFNPQNISSSQPPALVMTAKPTSGHDNQSNIAMIHAHNILNTAYSQSQSKVPTSINMITSSTLLHTQLTSPLKRSKSTDEAKTEVIVGHIQPTKRHSVESVIVKSEPMEVDETGGTVSCDTGIKSIHLAAVQRGDESQNVLLKQLLQTTTASAATTVQTRPMPIQRTAPALGSIPSLEAQLARPSIPPPALTIPQEVEIPKNSPRQITSRESFITRPLQNQTNIVAQPSTQIQPPVSSTQSLMDVRKPTNLQISQPKEEPMIFAETPTAKNTSVYQSMNIESNIQQTIKKEVLPPQQSPIQRPFTPMDVKKELLDESSQQSAASGVSNASDQCKLENPLKEEFPEGAGMDTNSENVLPETPSEAKKRKRREYQQKRRQMQNNMKVTLENNNNASQAKKKPRKGSKLEEDYDTFIDNLMVQLRQLQPMQIQEPTLTTNLSVCPLFGSGDLTKLKTKDYDIMKGDLLGEFGNARIPSIADYYNTKPFGDEEPLPEKPPASTQRGFYDQEFPPIRFEDDAEDKKLDLICKERDTDTPDSIVSCSSPECMDTDSPNRFPGLKLIDDEEEEDDSDSGVTGRTSPIIPVIAPVPIRVKPVYLYESKDDNENLKTVKTDITPPLKSKMVDSPGSNDSNENVTVTLTLTSGAAEDILGVLRELAGILHIPPPTAYQIIERTATPPSHKLGLYRSKGRDGKEGMPIDIQSILNGAAKFCRHCDVVILDSVVRAKSSEFPLLSSNKTNGEDILGDSESELYFCSKQCYESFAWRPTNIIQDSKTKGDDKSEIDTNTSKDRDDFDTASTESMETDDLDIKPDIKDEKMDLSFIDSLDNDELMKEVVDDVAGLTDDIKTDSDDKRSEEETEEPERFRGIRYKAWSPGCIAPPMKYKRPTDRELTELVFRTGVAIMPVKPAEDVRKCELCGIQGDGVADGVSRLLNCDVDRWVHLNCALWSDGVYETVSGALMNVDSALAAGMNATCAVCRRLGATVRCFKVRCGNVYHLGCAVKDDCVFHKNKTAYCASHAPKGEKDNELTTLSVQRRVYVSRDEQRQVASVMLHSDMNHLIRVGGLIFLSPGHLLPHQLTAFHTPNYIYPVGYKIVRFYWSMKKVNSRCRYICWISDEDGRPHFHVQAQDDTKEEMAAATARAAWAKVLDAVAALREERTHEGVLKLWPQYVTGEDLFGLTEPAVVRVLESLPGIETLIDYRFKFGRSALLEGGLAVNPSGCARAEPRGRAPAFRRPPRSLLPSTPSGVPHSAITPDHPACPYSKQFVHTKSSQYKKMKLEWRNNVYLARSKIQGLGLYAARDIEKHTMVIEYIGELIRSELSEMREKKYEARNRGIYMFRLDDNRVVDATMSGGLARYINHSCQPNCVAEAVEVDRNLRIIIFAKRRISRGEELAYDYKFDIEDDAHKIMCMCGAPNCRKWMN